MVSLDEDTDEKETLEQNDRQHKAGMETIENANSSNSDFDDPICSMRARDIKRIAHLEAKGRYFGSYSVITVVVSCTSVRLH